MNFIQLDIYTKSEGIQLLAVRLEDIGITGLVIHDSADFDEFLTNKDANWDYIDDDLMKLKDLPVYVTAYIPDDTQGKETVNAVRNVLDELKNSVQAELFGELRLEIDSVREEDWENNWKQYYKPFKIGKRFVIKPTWENVDEVMRENRLILEIDPASSFGTGQHASTQLCIEALEEIISSDNVNMDMLDLGCGSGILSAAGLLLGANSVTMIDIFENAVRTATENVKQNGFDETKFKAYCGNILENDKLRDRIGFDNKYDVITANIVADVIIPMSVYFKQFLKAGGFAVLSGIITERLDEVLNAVRSNDSEVISVKEKDGWNAVVCVLK